MRGRDNIKLRTYIRKCSHCMSRGHEAAVKSCFIHTRGNVAGTFIRSSQQAQNVLTHTQAQLQLLRVPGTCTDKVLQCLSSSCHTISHLCFVIATCPAKVHLAELYAACCSNECCKKDDFYRVNSSGASVCSFTTDLTNHRQQINGNTILSCLRTCDKDSINTPQLDENRWIITLFWNAINTETKF